jgi:hypothetical protein
MKAVLNLILFLSFATFAQQPSHSISGTVKDSRNEIIPGATIRLLKFSDSVAIHSEISNAQGKFEFINLLSGKYILAVSASGNRVQTTSPIQVNDQFNKIILPAIVLMPSSAELKEVVVKAKRPPIEQAPDKTIVNVESMISSASSNTLEILGKTPGVVVGSNGEITLNGRGGVLVLIDGRATYMSGPDLTAYLKSLPGALLDKIELMDNPPSRYDAAGNAIINIRLKRNRAGGFTGNVSLGYTQGRYARNNDAINLNYNRNKLNLFGSFGYSYEKNYSLDTYQRKFFDQSGNQLSSVDLVNNQVYNSKGENINIGLDYALSKRTTYGFQVNYNENQRNGLLLYGSHSYNAMNQSDSIGAGSTAGKDKRNNFSLNMNLQHRFNEEGRELTADVNYIKYQSTGNQLLLNKTFLPDGSLSYQDAFLYDVPSDVDIRSGPIMRIL